MDIGGKIRELRDKRSLTMRQLAEMVPCTPSLISQIESGKADPSISTLKKIATALDANIVDFFSLAARKNDVVTRSDQRTAVQLPRWDARIQCLTTDVRRKEDAALLHDNEAGGRLARPVRARRRGMRPHPQGRDGACFSGTRLTCSRRMTASISPRLSPMTGTTREKKTAL